MLSRPVQGAIVSLIKTQRVLAVLAPVSVLCVKLSVAAWRDGRRPCGISNPERELLMLAD